MVVPLPPHGRQTLISALGKSILALINLYSIMIPQHPDNIIVHRYSDMDPYARTRVVVGNQQKRNAASETRVAREYIFVASWPVQERS
jgi:hypothetical protein